MVAVLGKPCIHVRHIVLRLRMDEHIVAAQPECHSGQFETLTHPRLGLGGNTLAAPRRHDQKKKEPFHDIVVFGLSIPFCSHHALFFYNASPPELLRGEGAIAFFCRNAKFCDFEHFWRKKILRF